MSQWKDLQSQVQKFCQERDWDQFHQPKDLAIGLVNEASELLELFKYKSEQECLDLLTDSVKKEKIEQELADCLFFLLRFSQKYEIDLPQAFEQKLELNAEKYPIEKFKGSNKKYNE